MLVFHGLRVLFANTVLLRVDMPRVGAPPLCGKPREPRRLQSTLEFETDCSLSPSKDRCHHGATVVMLGRRKARYPAARFLTPPV